jgi:peptidyl-prolyl cis-trans isomerase D
VRNQVKVTRNEKAIQQLRADLARTGTASGS